MLFTVPVSPFLWFSVDLIKSSSPVPELKTAYAVPVRFSVAAYTYPDPGNFPGNFPAGKSNNGIAKIDSTKTMTDKILITFFIASLAKSPKKQDPCPKAAIRQNRLKYRQMITLLRILFYHNRNFTSISGSPAYAGKTHLVDS